MKTWQAVAIAVASLFFGIFIGAAGSPDPEPLNPVQESVKTSTAKPPGIEDGTWEVGFDIIAGRYKSAGGDTCYWARLKSLDGGVGSIIANNIGAGPQVAIIKDSDAAFKTNGCGTWHLVKR